MKFLLISIFSVFAIISADAQDCERIVQNCEALLKSNANGSEYISDGQVYTAFLDRQEVAEFKTTLFGGTTYRIGRKCWF